MIVGVLLAAGRGARFGSDKRVAHLGGGRMLLEATIDRYLTVFAKLVVAVRPGDAVLAAGLRRNGVDFVYVPRAEEGMGSSLAGAVCASYPADGWVVGLGDMPFVRSSTLSAVRDALDRGSPIVAPYLDERRGHPVGFSAGLRAQLSRLRYDSGARSILQTHAAEIVKISVDDVGILQDIDLPHDLLHVARSQGAASGTS